MKLKRDANGCGNPVDAVSMSEPRHCLNDQYSRVHRLDEAFVRSQAIGFDDLIDRVGRNEH